MKTEKGKKVEVMEEILFASKKAYSGYVVRRWLDYVVHKSLWKENKAQVLNFSMKR